MNYANSDPASRLASGWWRVRHSAWLLAPILGIGMLSFIGFVYVALRVRSRRFWIACIIACIGSAAVWVFPTNSEWSGGIVLAVWAGLIVYGFVLNRDYLRWRAGSTRADAWYHQPSATNANARAAAPPSPEHRMPTQAAPPRVHGALGVSSEDYYASPVIRPTTSPYQSDSSSSRTSLDANAASRDELAKLPGVDFPLADRVVSARERQGTFRNIDDLVKAAALQPHELVRIRNRVTFGQSRSDIKERPTGLPGVRRLDY